MNVGVAMSSVGVNNMLTTRQSTNQSTVSSDENFEKVNFKIKLWLNSFQTPFIL